MIRVSFDTASRAIFLALAVLSTAASTEALAASTRLTITGSPSTSGTVGQTYAFTPTVTPASTTAKYYIGNKPSWATFDTSSGRLSGTPNKVGNTYRITIGVSEGRAFAWLPSFVIAVKAGSGGTSGGGSGGGGGTTNSAPTISGTPTTAVTAGSAYSFTPVASDANHDPLTFSVLNRPSWATFNSSTGALTGTPAAANAGNYANITISVSDGKASAALSPFTISVNNQTSSGGTGSAQINWVPPTQNTDGSALTGLAGYRITYGTDKTNLNKSVQVAGAGASSYVINNLSTGTWWFALASYTSSGTQSDPTAPASKAVN